MLMPKARTNNERGLFRQAFADADTDALPTLSHLFFFLAFDLFFGEDEIFFFFSPACVGRWKVLKAESSPIYYTYTHVVSLS